MKNRTGLGFESFRAASITEALSTSVAPQEPDPMELAAQCGEDEVTYFKMSS